MLMTEYPLHYWQGKGVFTAEIYGEEFMEFKVPQLLGAGNSALKMMILAHEQAGRDMGGMLGGAGGTARIYPPW
ncbi:hypothetical protein WP2W18C05_08320 [Aeromonas sp. WP2-W18-CRE-05]|nr:hypothetical protein WP2W18C05_08320 [Aeromonas sp. WP2-W18-CRE-05]